MLEIFIVTILGLLIGSFLSMCIYRVPIARLARLEEEEGEEPEEQDTEVAELVTDETDIALPPNHETVNILTPARSLCPKCGNQLHWYHNIPVVSWMALGGKCAFC